MEQRRKFIRLAVDATVSYKLQDSGNSPAVAELQDISISGVRMVGDKPLVKGALLDIVLRIPGLKEEIKVKGVLKWQRNLGMQIYDTGVEFTQIDDSGKALIVEFIKGNVGMVEDRREFVRCKLNAVIGYRLYDDLSSEVKYCESVDVSASGLKLVIKEEMEKGTKLRVSFKLPDEDGEIIALCTIVAWSQAKTDGAHEAGIEFLEISPEDQIKVGKYVKRNFGIMD
ncbi:MAG: PilZ domain-containing protein [Candidatus Omnitrophica bacterium]|nr:PilZ domain-containing protein [Candidatus Omnitrophota bacterium]MBU4479327.1 PilZ domain-containing protein [Candidatus Omnitrophota bacterium]MCG2704233.1 PilZ domain-containing protein [Candidatus Omnitrophota bacterium]